MSEYEEIVLFDETNKGGYKIQVIAQLMGPDVGNVRYLLRVSEPPQEDGGSIDYICTVDGFRKIGKLCTALATVVKSPLFATEKNIQKIRKFLTADKLETVADYLKAIGKG